ncbi:MAG TPA: M56 family metallopeptidase [Bryobacteraceae bacterium]|nr:M56 family metallopeptidase [Bryobacteraceae bacterium]
MIPSNLTPLANHLWQSTVFAAALALLSLVFRRQRAKVRYALWLAASVKFLIPFAVLMSIGSQLEIRPARSIAQSAIPVAMEQITQPFVPAAPAKREVQPESRITAVLLGIWMCGFAAVLFSWLVQWRRIRAAVRTASPLDLDIPIRAMSSKMPLEPGVFGVFRPVLLMPEGILDRLSPAQLRAILAHELCHVRRRDNLAASVHMLVEAIFWFHPLVWWVGARLVEERERACDEAVLSAAGEPEIYAEGILNVCKYYVSSPLRCVSGVTGSDLKRRIEEIMTGRMVLNLGAGKKLLLASAGALAIAAPVAVGIFNAPQVRAQSGSAKPLTFEVASIKPSGDDSHRIGIQFIPGGGMRTTGTTVKFLIGFAYDVRDFQVSGGPGWISSARYDITAKSERTESDGGPDDMRNMTDEQMKTNAEKMRERVRALLADRFQLTIHRETKESQIYALVLDKNGSKLKPSEVQEGGQRNRMMRMGRGDLNAEGVGLAMLTNALSNVLGRPVLDHTGLTGNFDFKLQWTPDPGQFGGVPPGPPPPGVDAPPPPDPNGPSLFTAVQEQLGLRLESQKGPVDLIVIDKVEKPSEN